MTAINKALVPEPYNEHDDLPKMTEEEMKLELKYWIDRAHGLSKNISLSIIRWIDGETVEMPLREMGLDQYNALERMEAIEEEIKSRRIP